MRLRTANTRRKRLARRARDVIEANGWVESVVLPYSGGTFEPAKVSISFTHPASERDPRSKVAFGRAYGSTAGG